MATLTMAATARASATWPSPTRAGPSSSSRYDGDVTRCDEMRTRCVRGMAAHGAPGAPCRLDLVSISAAPSRLRSSLHIPYRRRKIPKDRTENAHRDYIVG
eukprot:scaffold27204_cov65-Phaeocystis_antarctica.AAC.4